MESTNSKKRYYNTLIFACVGIYTAMMAVKGVFVAEIISVMNAFNTTKSLASIANTYYFIVYALTQFVLAFFIHKLPVKRYLAITISLSVVTYFILVFLLNEISQVWYLFAINGFAQGGVVAITKLILGKYLPIQYSSKANKMYLAGAAVGNASCYGVSGICVEFLSWKVPFIFFATLFACMLVFFIITLIKVEKNCKPMIVDKKEEYKNAVKTEKSFVVLPSSKSRAVFIVVMMVYAILTNVAAYAINNWMVVYLKEVFDFSESLSIFVTIGTLIVTMVGPMIGISLSQRFKNYATLSAVLYIFPLVITFIMIFLYNFNFIFSLVLLVLFEICNSCASGCSANLVFDMRSQINPGRYSAFNNVSASLAAGIVPTIVSVIIDSWGWSAQYMFVTITYVVIILMMIILNRVIKSVNRKYLHLYQS